MAKRSRETIFEAQKKHLSLRKWFPQKLLEPKGDLHSLFFMFVAGGALFDKLY